MRSLNSFGVAGLLSPKCDIFYTNDLRARNVGRISDLVSAKLREEDVDELRIRALLVYGVFQTFAVRNLPNHHSEDVPAASVEVGVDGNYVAVGIAFHWDPSNVPKWNGLAQRVGAGTPGDAFERAIEWINRHSTQVIVRYELMERRVEVVSLLNRTDAELKDPIAVVSVDSNRAPLLEVSNYVELGDLNFSKLLKNPTAADTVKIDDRTPQQTLETVKIAGSETAEEDEEIRVIAGAAAERAIERRFTGKTDASDEIEEMKSVIADYERTVAGLRGTVQQLRSKLDGVEETRVVSGGSVDPVEEPPIVVKGSGAPKTEDKDDWGFHFLKQVWPFAPKETVVGPPPLTEDEASTVAGVENPGGMESPSEDGASESEETESNPAGQILQELKTIASTGKSKKVQATLEEIAEEVEGDKAKRWVDNLSSELIQEKSRLAELQKNLSKQMRQRELEFKTAERALKQELNRKEEMLRQKQTALDTKSDQIAQLNLAVERASSAVSDKESQQTKQKLERAQRMAQMKEEEAKSLVTKVRDLENRLIIAQAKAQKGNDLQMATKVQSLEKKLEEYKRVNQRLMESLNQQKDKSNDKEIGDLRRKIDQLDRLASEAKRNLEKTAFKLRETQESERKLQTDLARAVEENRSLRKNQSPRGSGESGGQAA